MKNLCKLLLSAVGFLFLLEGCNNSSNNTVESSYEQTAENRKAEILSLKNELLPQSRTIKKQDSLFSIPFEPLWQSARYSKNNYTETVDVDIKSKDEIVAIINDTCVYAAKQMLSIVVDNMTQRANMYKVTFIPFHKGFKTSTFYTSGSKSSYSGFVIYTSINENEIFMVSKYRNGDKVETANVFGLNGNDLVQARKRIDNMLSKVHLFDKSTVYPFLLDKL